MIFLLKKPSVWPFLLDEALVIAFPRSARRTEISFFLRKNLIVAALVGDAFFCERIAVFTRDLLLPMPSILRTSRNPAP